MAEKRAKFSIVDDWPLRHMPFECDAVDGKRGEIVEPEIDEFGIPYFDAPLDTVRRLIAAQPKRFKLVRSQPIICAVHNADFGIEYKTFNPWYYERYTKLVDDPNDPDEKIATWCIEWKEKTSPPWDSDTMANIGKQEQVATKSTWTGPAPQTVGVIPDGSGRVVVHPSIDSTKNRHEIMRQEREKTKAVIGDLPEKMLVSNFLKKAGKTNVAILSMKEYGDLIDALQAAQKPVGNETVVPETE